MSRKRTGEPGVRCPDKSRGGENTRQKRGSRIIVGTCKTAPSDVIQEFFVPIPRFVTFMEGMRGILQEEKTNLLGVTLRYVRANNETALSYAPKEDAFAVILYFNELCSANGRAKANGLINRLVHLAVNCGGTFYLTYARDLEMDCLRKGYREIDAFFQKKHAVDPENRFTSRFFELHGKRGLARQAASGR